MNPKNQKQLVIYYLKRGWSFSLKDVINDTMFFKFQTRLSEIEQEFGTIATRTKINFKNRFGRKSKYNVYTACVSNEKLDEIYKFYN